MADFALWATACETALWPTGTFTRAYAANRRAAIEGIIEADPVAACVRQFMSERSSWTGSAAELLRISVQRSSESSRGGNGWPKNPRALAGQLRRAQTSLRALGIDIAFRREGRAGSRVIMMRASLKIPSAPSAASARIDQDPTQNDLRQDRWAATTQSTRPAHGPGKFQSGLQMMLTVLTQRSPVVLSKSDES